jgi:uncharacterized membrane protein YgdD (TMEM256/DUF423 family)
MTRFLLVAGAILGALSVVSGAFAAHALQGVLSERALGWYDTAVTYHAHHALALLLCGVMAHIGYLNRALRVAGLALLSGTVIFSGSLYVMAFTGMTWLGAVTPIGGVLLIVGWVALATSALGAPAMEQSSPRTYSQTSQTVAER